MNHHGASPWIVFLENSSVEGQERRGIVRHSTIWPGSKLKVINPQRSTQVPLQLCIHFQSLLKYQNGNLYLDTQFPYGIVSQYLLASQGHLNWAKLTAPTLRPVVLTLCFPSLHQVGDHDNGGWSLLPHQSPEVNHCFGQGACSVICIQTQHNF